MLLALTLLASAGTPTHSAMDSATWAEAARKANASTGEVVISQTLISEVDCFKGEATTDVQPAKLLEVVADVEGAPRWSSAGVTKAKLLKNGGTTIEYYQYLDVPGWTMASDRFWFLTANLERSDTRTALRWSKLTDGGGHAEYKQVKAENPSAVEPPINVGSWVFDASGGSTKVTYQICTHPGGSIPTAIQNAATRKTLPDTLGDVVKEAKKR